MKNISEKNRSLIAVALMGIGVLTVIGGAAKLKNNFSRPFNLPEFIADEKTPEELEKEQLASKDTDGDSINDYDELYVYGTSPYLKDSDSDGREDNVEIAEGEDPNCPIGEDCYGNIAQYEKDYTQNNSNFIETRSNTNTNIDFSSLRGILPENPTPEEIRELLREAGIEEDILNQFTDDELLQTYSKTLNEY